MPRLGLGIHEFAPVTRRRGNVRLGLHHANRPNGILYVGVTSEIRHRAWQHRTGAVPGFTKKYGLKRLVFAEPHETIQAAIRREKVIKGWSRAWKVRLVVEHNPDWTDLYEHLV